MSTRSKLKALVNSPVTVLAEDNTIAASGKLLDKDAHYLVQGRRLLEDRVDFVDLNNNFIVLKKRKP